MRAKRTDANHAEIKRAFESLGCSVVDLSAVGGGVPDLLVARGGKTILVEVKTSTGRTLQTQKDFWLSWRGLICVCRSMEDVRKIFG